MNHKGNIEETPSTLMERTTKILRKSIYLFLQNFPRFTSTAAFLALPFSITFLFSQALLLPSPSSPSSSSPPPPPPLLQTAYQRLETLFDAAGFPPSSYFFNILCLKLSQTLSSIVFSLPFTLSFLLLAKAFVIQSLTQTKPPLNENFFSSLLSTYIPLLQTYICSLFVILSANASAFFLLFFAFNSLEGFPISSSGYLPYMSVAAAVLYSIILANALIICNLAMALSGLEKRGGSLEIVKAFVLIKGRTTTALSLAVPLNLILAATEALFRYRIITSFQDTRPAISVSLEGMFIAYLYSIVIVLDTIVSYLFSKSCLADAYLDYEDTYYCEIRIPDEENLIQDGLRSSN